MLDAHFGQFSDLFDDMLNVLLRHVVLVKLNHAQLRVGVLLPPRPHELADLIVTQLEELKHIVEITLTEQARILVLRNRRELVHEGRKKRLAEVVIAVIEIGHGLDRCFLLVDVLHLVDQVEIGDFELEHFLQVLQVADLPVHAERQHVADQEQNCFLVVFGCCSVVVRLNC